MSEGPTSPPPPRRPPSPAARVLVTIGKLTVAVGELVRAVGSVNNALHGAIDQFSEYHGERKAAERRLNGKLDALMRHLGVEYHEPPPDALETPRNGNGPRQ